MDLPARPYSIVVGVDGSDHARAAVRWAAHEASRRGLPVHVVHAFAPDYPTVTFGHGLNTGQLREEATAVLESAEEQIHSIDRTIRVTGSSTRGYASGALVRASRDATMVVLGARGLGILGAVALGSVSLQVATHAHCPVIIVRHDEGPRDLPKVVAGFDGSQRSMEAVEFAYAQSEARGAELVVVHAWWPAEVEHAQESAELAWSDYAQQQEALVSEAVAGLAERHPDVQVTRRILEGNPADALVAESQDADLVVVGNRGAGGFAGLKLGSVTHAVLRGAACPIVVVRRDDHHD